MWYSFGLEPAPGLLGKFCAAKAHLGFSSPVP